MEILNKEVREATKKKFDVFGVPKTVINDIVFIDGAVPEAAFLENVLKAIAAPEIKE